MASVLCVAVAISAAATTVSELNTLFRSGGPVEEEFAAVLSGDLKPASSDTSRQLVLDGCTRLIDGFYGRAQPEDKWTALLAACGDQARSITSEMPAQAYAWFVRAVVAAESGDVAEVSPALSISQVLSPNLGWLATYRVRLGVEHFDLLDDQAKASQREDIATLVASRAGVSAIAGFYASDPAFRGRVTQVVETLSEDDQRRFVAALRSVMARRAQGQPS